MGESFEPFTPVVPGPEREDGAVERCVCSFLRSYRAAVRRGEDPPLNTLAEIIAHDARKLIARDIAAERAPVEPGIAGYAVGNATFNEGLDRAIQVVLGSVS